MLHLSNKLDPRPTALNRNLQRIRFLRKVYLTVDTDTITRDEQRDAWLQYIANNKMARAILGQVIRRRFQRDYRFELGDDIYFLNLDEESATIMEQ